MNQTTEGTHAHDTYPSVDVEQNMEFHDIIVDILKSCDRIVDHLNHMPDATVEK